MSVASRERERQRAEKIESNGCREDRCESFDKWRDKPRPAPDSEYSSHYKPLSLRENPMAILPVLLANVMRLTK